MNFVEEQGGGDAVFLKMFSNGRFAELQQYVHPPHTLLVVNVDTCKITGACISDTFFHKLPAHNVSQVPPSGCCIRLTPTRLSHP